MGEQRKEGICTLIIPTNFKFKGAPQRGIFPSQCLPICLSVLAHLIDTGTLHQSLPGSISKVCSWTVKARV